MAVVVNTQDGMTSPTAAATSSVTDVYDDMVVMAGAHGSVMHVTREETIVAHEDVVMDGAQPHETTTTPLSTAMTSSAPAPPQVGMTSHAPDRPLLQHSTSRHSQ